LRRGVFGVVDGIQHKIIFVDASGEPLGAAQLPPEFQARDLDLGDEVILRGDNADVQVPHDIAVDAGKALETRAPTKSSISVSRFNEGLRLSLMTSDTSQTIDVEPRKGGRVVDATFLGNDQNGDAYVYWQEQVGGQLDSTRAMVGRFTRGILGPWLELDLADFASTPAVPIAFSGPGELVLMQPGAASITLQRIHLSENREEIRPIGSLPVQVLDVGEPEIIPPPSTRPASEEERSTPPPYDAARAAVILSRARQYLTLAWPLRAQNFQHAGVENRCEKRAGKYWSRPLTVQQEHIGQQLSGMPYRWGGFDTVPAYLQKIASPSDKLAGNVCTCRETQYGQCIVSESAGIDCSGFVSRAWGLSTHTGTSQLSAVSAPLNNLNDLRPGDALNKPGSHVRLFVRFEPGPEIRIRTLESAISCGGVCEKVYRPAQLVQYRPIRLR
jgi:hypothetical protein